MDPLEYGVKSHDRRVAQSAHRAGENGIGSTRRCEGITKPWHIRYAEGSTVLLYLIQLSHPTELAQQVEPSNEQAHNLELEAPIKPFRQRTPGRAPRHVLLLMGSTVAKDHHHVLDNKDQPGALQGRYSLVAEIRTHRQHFSGRTTLLSSLDYR